MKGTTGVFHRLATGCWQSRCGISNFGNHAPADAAVPPPPATTAGVGGERGRNCDVYIYTRTYYVHKGLQANPSAPDHHAFLPGRHGVDVPVRRVGGDGAGRGDGSDHGRRFER